MLPDGVAVTIASLRPLRRRGTRIAIDDTGSGYSSLAHILKLAPDFIKLDRELTTGIDVDPVRRASRRLLSPSRPTRGLRVPVLVVTGLGRSTAAECRYRSFEGHRRIPWWASCCWSARTLVSAERCT
jgi:predicted signal transduction protein with EAL and GGDEF domain